MYRNLFILFVLLHVLGDFYFQTDALSEKKDSQYKYVVFHCVVYAAVFCAGTAAIWSPQMFTAILVLSLLHFAVDSLKYRCLKSHRNFSESLVYCTDQCIHLFSLILAVFLFKYNHFNIVLLPGAKRLFGTLTNNGQDILLWACIILTVCKPANVTVKKLLSKYKPGGERGDRTFKNVGAFIGTLERIIIALLLSVNQYAAIGLVLTAKSVARYDKISKDQSFAEYYLLGTLLSTLFVILTYLLFH